MADQNQPNIERYKTQLALEVERYKGELQQQLETYKGDLSLYVVQGQVRTRAAIDFALAAIRGVLLINGGAVIAVLAFLSNLWAQNDASAKALAIGLETPIALFVAGAGLGTLTAMLTYCAQRAINELAPPEGRKVHWTAHFFYRSCHPVRLRRPRGFRRRRCAGGQRFHRDPGR